MIVRGIERETVDPAGPTERGGRRTDGRASLLADRGRPKLDHDQVPVFLGKGEARELRAARTQRAFRKSGRVVCPAANHHLGGRELDRVRLLRLPTILVYSASGWRCVVKNQWSGGWILVAAVVGFVLGLLPAILVQALVQDYQWARVVAAALSVAIAAAAALAGVLQYFRNSRNSRIERSMEFWKRSNCGDVKDHLEDFINYWAELRAGKQKLDFEALARTDDHTLEESKRKRKHHIECLLDFYDEACGAVKLGASVVPSLRNRGEK